MKTSPIRVVVKPQTEDNTTPTISCNCHVSSRKLIDELNNFATWENRLESAMDKVGEMDEDEFSPEKAIRLMTSLIRQSMKLQIFVSSLDIDECECLANIAYGMLNNVNYMILDLQEKFDEATGFNLEDEDEDMLRAAIAESINNTISATNQKIDKFCAKDEFDCVQAEALLTKARHVMHDLNETIEDSRKEGYEDIFKAAAENKAKLRVGIKKLNLFIAKHDEK